MQKSKPNIAYIGQKQIYENCSEIIQGNYNVKAYCFLDACGGLNCNSVDINYIKTHISEYDIVLLASSNALIDLQYIVNVGKVPLKLIRNFLYEEFLHPNEIGIISPMERFVGENCEDAVLANLVGKMQIDVSKMHYLEIGTNDPIFGNNSFFFYQKGARGILVDPVASVGLMAQIARPEDKFIRAAVTGIAKQKTTRFFVNEEIPAVSSLSRTWLEAADQSHRTVTEIEVDLFGINDLLRQADLKFDLLLVDAEGEDLNILHSIDYNAFSPTIIIVEAFGMGLVSFMKSKGYTWYATVKGTNSIFVRNESC